MNRIYVASSWRNKIQPVVVDVLRQRGFDVYDFKNPEPGNHGFHWSEIDPKWTAGEGQRSMSLRDFRDRALLHNIANKGFDSDFGAMLWADQCVLVLPCGRSAHLEAGWFIGQGKPCHILLSTDQFEPELMYKMTDSIHVSIEELISTMEKK